MRPPPPSPPPPPIQPYPTVAVPVPLDDQLKPTVRSVADLLLRMVDDFRSINNQQPVPYFTISAGMAVGALFTSFDGSSFMNDITGPAHDAATQLCAAAQAPAASGAAARPGVVLCTDGVMQLLSLSHVFSLVDGGYRLERAAGMEHPRTVELASGLRHFYELPVFAGMRSLSLSPWSPFVTCSPCAICSPLHRPSTCWSDFQMPDTVPHWWASYYLTFLFSCSDTPYLDSVDKHCTFSASLPCVP